MFEKFFNRDGGQDTLEVMHEEAEDMAKFIAITLNQEESSDPITPTVEKLNDMEIGAKETFESEDGKMVKVERREDGFHVLESKE